MAAMGRIGEELGEIEHAAERFAEAIEHPFRHPPAQPVPSSHPYQQEEQVTTPQQPPAQPAPRQPAPQQPIDVIGSAAAIINEVNGNNLIKSLAARGLGKNLDQGDIGTVLSLVSRLERP